MNFRSCQYFLTVCEEGTINAAARKLYISQQSLSHHIRRMEEELGVQLFHRGNPLALTESGRSVQKMSRAVLDAYQQMFTELSVCKGMAPKELTVGVLDFGLPKFMLQLIEMFLNKYPDVLIQTKEIPPGGPLPRDIPLFIGARELDAGFKCRVLITDRLGVSVADALLKKLYGPHWQERKAMLEAGELTALVGCPFLRHQDTPFQRLQDMAYEVSGFYPEHLPVRGSFQALAMMCAQGQGALIAPMERLQIEDGLLPCYPISTMPERIPTAYLCRRADAVLSIYAQHFWEITVRYFKGRQ